jgi:predicted HAD superfamily Cof-like phosphohydrolase
VSEREYEPPKDELIRERDELRKRVGSLKTLGDVEDMITQLKNTITQLQADNTRLLEERRGVDERYMVEHFHRVCDVPVLPEPRVPAEKRVRLRLNLIAEEFFELLDSCIVVDDFARSSILGSIDRVESIINVDLVEFADACADLKYVIVGSELEFGIDGRPIFRGVHEANLKKADGPRRADGKVQKPEGWKPFDVAEELRRQGWRS